MAQSYTFTDQSGIDTSSHANPYDALLEACHNDAVSCCRVVEQPCMMFL